MSQQIHYDENGNPIERRSIPIHILNHIDERLGTHMDKVDGQFVALRLEMAKDREEALERHNQIVELLGLQVQKQQKLEDAFLKNENGEIDVSGHFYDHDHRKRISIWINKHLDNMIGGVLKAVGAGTVIWAFMALWEAFLKGPRS